MLRSSDAPVLTVFLLPVTFILMMVPKDLLTVFLFWRKSAVLNVGNTVKNSAFKIPATHTAK